LTKKERKKSRLLSFLNVTNPPQSLSLITLRNFGLKWFFEMRKEIDLVMINYFRIAFCYRRGFLFCLDTKNKEKRSRLLSFLNVTKAIKIYTKKTLPIPQAPSGSNSFLCLTILMT